MKEVPEYKTSQTCCRCGGACGRHSKVERNRIKDHRWWQRREIRGLRLCQNSECRRPLNRDANSAVNIGANLMLGLLDLPYIRVMTEEDIELATMDENLASDDEDMQ